MKNDNGLEPHKESKIVITMVDKIIFAVGATAYGIMLILEEKLNKDNEISSSVAIVVAGTFLVLKVLQNRKTKKLIFLKDKLLFLFMLIGGIALDIASIVSLIRYLIK